MQNCFDAYSGYGSSLPGDRCRQEGSAGATQNAEGRSATGPSGPAGIGALHLGEGVSAPQIAKMVPVTPQAIRRLAHRYEQAGLEGALYERQRPGAAEVLDTNQKQRIIAMVCSDPPEGRARWTVRLVAEEAVKRKLVPRVGRETIRILLLSHDLKPWREKNVVRRRPDRRVSGKDGGRTGGI